jgi:DNA-binding NarL/FixJ family response regulator
LFVQQSVAAWIAAADKPFTTATKVLRKRPDLPIIGHVSDGLEALEQAQEPQPDLILLDIGLSTLNGTEAARRIREVSPRAEFYS